MRIMDVFTHKPSAVYGVKPIRNASGYGHVGKTWFYLSKIS